MTLKERQMVYGILVRASVALRTNLGARESLAEIEDTIEIMERVGVEKGRTTLTNQCYVWVKP